MPVNPAAVSPPVWDLFFGLIAEGNTATTAAKTLGLNLRYAYTLRKRHKDIAERWAQADQAGTEALEQEAFRRAVQGIEKGVYYQGVKCDSEREYSDALLMFLLKARAPEKYKDRYEVKHELGEELVRRLQAGRARAAGLLSAPHVVEGEAVEVIDVDDPILA